MRSLFATATARFIASYLAGDDERDLAFPVGNAERDLVFVGFFVAFVFALLTMPEAPRISAAVEVSGLAAPSLIFESSLPFSADSDKGTRSEKIIDHLFVLTLSTPEHCVGLRLIHDIF